jgi:hypothetical protein
MLEQCILDIYDDMENAVDQYVKLFGSIIFLNNHPKASKWLVFASSDWEHLLLFGQVNCILSWQNYYNVHECAHCVKVTVRLEQPLLWPNTLY